MHFLKMKLTKRNQIRPPIRQFAAAFAAETTHSKACTGCSGSTGLLQLSAAPNRGKRRNLYFLLYINSKLKFLKFNFAAFRVFGFARRAAHRAVRTPGKMQTPGVQDCLPLAFERANQFYLILHPIINKIELFTAL